MAEITLSDAMSLARGVKKAAAEGRDVPLVAMAAAKLSDELESLQTHAKSVEEDLRKTREQEPVAFWWIGPDGKDNGGPYRGKPSDFAIDNARNTGCEPILLYARPVPAAPAVAVPAVPDQFCDVTKLIVP